MKKTTLIFATAFAVVGMLSCGGGASKGGGQTQAVRDDGINAAQEAQEPQAVPKETVTEDVSVEKLPAGRSEVFLGTVTIGGKAWMKENLNIETENSWCYDDDPANCEKYGRLYTWEAAVSACASLGDGWRLPTNDDWDALINTVGGEDIAGTKLKSKTGWEVDPDCDGCGELIPGTDEYGFSALPGGSRGPDGTFSYAGYYGHWWTAVEGGASNAWFRLMAYRYEFVYSSMINKADGFSVRCVKDAN